MPGFAEWIIILVIVLLVFGHNKLPALGDALGRSIKNFRRASKGADEIEVTPRKPELGEAKSVEKSSSRSA